MRTRFREKVFCTGFLMQPMRIVESKPAFTYILWNKISVLYCKKNMVMHYYIAELHCIG